MNGGNATGTVFAMPGPELKDNPTKLADNRAGPVKGRSYFRVDDIVQRGGCANKGTGTGEAQSTPETNALL